MKQAKFLKNATNLLGPIDNDIEKRIQVYITNPTTDNWSNIQSILIDGWTTIWQAVMTLDPTFPNYGRSTTLEGKIVKEWERIPHPFIIKRAIKAAIAEGNHEE